jgi:hypothetical protein
MFSGEAKAQETLREPLSASQKSDDGALVALPKSYKRFHYSKS